MKLKVTTACGALALWLAAVHGEVPHRLLFSLTVVGEATGTLMPRPGIANVCCTEQSAHESKACTGVVGRPGDLPPERVPQRRAAVVAEDRHIHPRSGGNLEVRGVIEVAGGRV